MAFSDKCYIKLVAGNGGDGMLAWRREAHVPMGGPAGGNGGNGGSIYFVGDHNETSLETLKYQKIIRAPHGEKGDIKNQHGKNALDVYVKVPLGTVVIDASTFETITEVLIDKAKYLITRGGQGGHGNMHFKSAFNKAPNLYERGEKGEMKDLFLNLKTIADIGIVGLPNAGKSTLISTFTNAKPKTAAYQFTTLNPVLGTIYHHDQRIIFADIPGLIKGAHKGTGLGFDFLKHIERCFLLMHIISLDDNDHEVSIIDSFDTIMNEMKEYSSLLQSKPMIVVANKIDALNSVKNLEILSQHINNRYPLISVSALEYTNIKEMLDLVVDYFNQSKEKMMKENTSGIDELITYHKKERNVSKSLDQTIVITRTGDHSFSITGEYLEYWVNRIPLTTQDNLIRLNQKLDTINFKQQLKDFGVEQNDTLNIYDITLNYEE
ncbi:GTPase ObgE [Ureaplasma canigenitalium]|uniref:GTPase ObgE n=1 Tax=Ureaplasma canigenitalium TaxID=42092 RepID=UPI0004E154D0|nr:GTPase ObgE [Ureaplasma canigenitalium]